jgi:hypothetical protein
MKRVIASLQGINVDTALMRGWLAFVAPYKRALAAVAFLAVVAYGFIAFSHTMAGDEWTSFQTERYQHLWSIQIGRWVAPIIWSLLGDNALAPTFTITLFVCAQMFAFLLAARVIGLRSAFAVFALMATSAFFPFWAEAVNFKLLHSTFAFGLPMSCLAGTAMWLAWRESAAGKRLVAAAWVLSAAVGLSLVLSTYQGLSQFAIILFLAAILNRIVLRAGEPPSLREAVSLVYILVGTVVLGAALYWAEVAITQEIYGTSPLQGQYALGDSLIGSWNDLSMSVSRLVSYNRSFLVSPNHLFPFASKLLFLVTLAVVVHRVTRVAPSSITRWVLLVVCLVGMFVAPWAIGLIRVPFSYRYIALASAALLYGAVVGIANEWSAAPFLRGVVRVCSILIVVIFVFEQNSASLITYENNRRDLAITNRLLARIESDPHYRSIDPSKPVRLLVYGIPAMFTGRPFSASAGAGPLSESIISCGIYDCQLFRIPDALRLLSTDRTRYVITPADQLDPAASAMLESKVAQMSMWPAVGSVTFIDSNTIVIKFSETR